MIRSWLAKAWTVWPRQYQSRRIPPRRCAAGCGGCRYPRRGRCDSPARPDPSARALSCHVQVLGDQDGAVRLGVGEISGAGENAIVGRIEIGKKRARLAAARRFLDEFPLVALVLERGVDEDVEHAAVLELHAGAHLLGGAEAFAQAAMDLAGIRAAGRGLRLEAIEFLQHFDGNPDHVVLKLEHRLRVVNQDVGVENVVLGGGEIGLFDGHGFGVFQGRVCGRS